MRADFDNGTKLQTLIEHWNGTTLGARVMANARQATHSREWSSMMLSTSNHTPGGGLDVGDVGLPAFVGEVGGEPLSGALGPLVRLRGDEPAGPQHPPDGGHRRRVAGPAGQVGVDGHRPGVEPGAEEVLAHGDDVFFPPAGDPGGAVTRAGL